MIWLASYPYSGSAFLRFVLEQVYDVRSSSYAGETLAIAEHDSTPTSVVETHLLPHQLMPVDRRIPAIYLLRDARHCEALLAQATEASEAPEVLQPSPVADDTGCATPVGWSEHVRAWTPRAGIVIHFEELLLDPVGTCERLRPWLPLPEPRVDRVPRLSDGQRMSGSDRRDPVHTGGRERSLEARAETELRVTELSEAAHLRCLREHGWELLRCGYVERDVVERARAGHDPEPRTFPYVGKNSRRRTVVVDATKLLDPTLDGIRRYTQGLLGGLIGAAAECAGDFRLLAQIDTNTRYDLLEIDDFEQLDRLVIAAQTPRGQIAPWLRGVPRRVLSRLRRTAYRVSRIGKRQPPPPDLVHLLLPNNWSLYESVSSARVTTVHDCSHLRCPELQTDANNETLGAGLLDAVRRDSDYVADSQSTRRDLIELCGISSERISIAYLGSDARFRPGLPAAEIERVARTYALPRAPYLLALNTFEPRKNLLRLVRAFKSFVHDHPRSELCLVLAGSPGWGEAGTLRKEIDDCTRVKVAGRVEERDIAALYAGAHLFAYVSTYEGFGLPPLEAMSSGVPVIYGRGTAVEEVVGATGLGAVPTDEADIALQIARLATNSELRRDLSRAAALRSTAFDWRSTAASTLDAYERRLSRGERASRTSNGEVALVSSPAAPSQPQSVRVHQG